jgi:hypothetical protein
MDFTQYLPYALLTFGLISIVKSCFYVSKKSNLKEIGIPVDGIVFTQSGDSVDDVNKKVEIRFVTKNQEWITGPINQDFQIFYTGQYKDGDHVKVFYNPAAPTEFYVDTKQSELIPRILGGLTGICLILIGLYQIFA